MKKLKKVKLHNLSQAEITSREQYLLKGGKVCGCVTVCEESICTCYTPGEGSYPLSNDNARSHSGLLESALSNGDWVQSSTDDPPVGTGLINHL